MADGEGDIAPRLNEALAAAKADPDRKFWITLRQSLIIALGAIEDRLRMKRSIVPKHKLR